MVYPGADHHKSSHPQGYGSTAFGKIFFPKTWLQGIRSKSSKVHPFHSSLGVFYKLIFFSDIEVFLEMLVLTLFPERNHEKIKSQGMVVDRTNNSESYQGIA